VIFSRRRVKPALALVAFLVLGLSLTACVVFKEGSLRLSQPQGIGPVNVHFELCTELAEGTCAPNEDEGQSQYTLGIAVPQGSTAPATITAAPVNGGAPIVFNRNDEVAQAVSRPSEGGEEGFPPPGMQAVGYLSTVHTEETGVTREWTVDAGFGLPVGGDGGTFGGPFAVEIVYGWRQVDGTHSADRPVSCFEPAGEPPVDATAICGGAAQGTVGTSDLKIAPPAQVSAYIGGVAKFAFPLDFASTAASLPNFNLTATSTLPKAQLKVGNSTFTPGPLDSTTHRSPTAPQTVTVTVPSNAKPGTYDVTLTAKTPQGGTVSQVAKLKVTKAKLSLGGVKLNKTKGIATLTVKIPGAGTVIASGKGIAKVKKPAKKAQKPKTLKLTIKAKGKAKKQLAEEGTAKVSAKITFKPLSGTPVTKTKKITLKQN